MSTKKPLANQLILSPEVFPARPSALPEKVQWTLRSGKKCTAAYASLNPDGLLQKMFLGLLLEKVEWHSKPCVLTWKMKVLPCSHRLLFQLAPSMPRIVATEFGLLPTPTTAETNYSLQGNSQTSKNLGALARKGKLFPTPKTSMATIQDLIQANYHSSNRPIYSTLFPTPTANDFKNLRLPKSQIDRDGLAGSILRGELLPTPTAADHWKGKLKSSQQKPESKHSLDLPSAVGGSLNPRFVAQMMGYPPEWCEI
jgi:hypothetical protein